LNRYKDITGSHLFWGIVATITILFSSGRSSTNKEAPSPTPLPTSPALAQTTYLVQGGNVIGEIRFRGSIVPINQENVYFQAKGYIRKVYVDKGDLVTAGQKLAKLGWD
jgi:multidrug efflux pump subunit AcrA (membrane-fusion protein)